MSTFLKADAIVRTSDSVNRWRLLFSLFGQYFLQNLLIILILCWFFNAGLFLVQASNNLLSNLMDLATRKEDRAKRFLHPAR